MSFLAPYWLYPHQRKQEEEDGEEEEEEEEEEEAKEGEEAEGSCTEPLQPDVAASIGLLLGSYLLGSVSVPTDNRRLPNSQLA